MRSKDKRQTSVLVPHLSELDETECAKSVMVSMKDVGIEHATTKHSLKISLDVPVPKLCSTGTGTCINIETRT